MNLANKAALTAALLFIGGFLPLVYFSTLALERNLMELLANQQTAAVRHVATDLEENMHLRIEALQDVMSPTNCPVDRLAEGNFGDHKFCRDGVWELRIDQGAAYRVYYAMDSGVGYCSCVAATKAPRALILNALGLRLAVRPARPTVAT